MLTLDLFGHPKVKLAGEEVTGFHSNKARALLFYLAVTGRTQARTVLAGLFWGGFPDSQAMSNLRKTLSNLRKLVGDNLDIERDRVTFDQTSDYWLDVADFKNQLKRVESGEDLEAAEHAVTLYKGEFLEGFYLEGAPEWEDWTLAERQRLREGYYQTLQELAHLHAEKGDYLQAIHHVQSLLHREPLREEIQRLLMTLYARNGQRGRALRQYEICQQILADELGVETAPETVALVEAIRTGDIGPPRKMPSGGSGHLALDLIPQFPGFLEGQSGASEDAGPLFIGREQELEILDEQLTAARAGDGRVFFVTGEAGRGKSALLAEFTRRALKFHQDLVVATGKCNAFSGAGDPFHPFHEIMDQLVGDVEARWRAGTIPREQARRLWELLPITAQILAATGPGLLNFFVSGPALLERLSAFASQDMPGLVRLRATIENREVNRLEQDQLLSQFANVLSALAQRHPLLIILDDMQWVDNASLDLLFHLARQLPGQPIFILGAYRHSDAALVHGSNWTPGLSSLISELKRGFGRIKLDLDQISSDDERRFVDVLLDSKPNRLDESFRSAFYQRTKGHPLFSIELLRDMQARGDLILDKQGKWTATRDLDWESMPARVEAVISQRIRRLQVELRELLAAASVEGEVFHAEVIAHVLKRDERWVLHRLSRLEKEHRLVHELAEINLDEQRFAQYKFNHILFQDYLYHDLSQGERRMLHQAVAATLEDWSIDHQEAVLVPLARHYTEAGQAAKAIPYLLAAGDRARTQNAFREALYYYHRALDFLKEKRDHEEAARTLMKIGLTHHNASSFEQARIANEEAFRLWQQVARSRVSRDLPPAPHALRIAGENFSGTLDPAMVKETPRALLLQQLFSGLMRLGQNLELLPDLAEGWEVLDQGRRYRFHLRRGAYWSDGTPVTAGDFEFAWKRVLDPATASPNAMDLFDIKGARRFHVGMGNPDEVGVRALDDVNLQVELEEASPYFPNMLFFESTKPVPRHVVSQYGSDWMQPDHIVTNGPFRLVSYTPGGKMVLKRNPDYYGSFSGNVEQVEIHLGLGEDRLRHLEMYLAGNLDVLYTFSHLPPEIQKSTRGDLVGEYRSGPSLATWLVGYVLNRPPFDDRRIRQAFAMATDRQTLANVIHSGLVLPAIGGFLSPVHAAYSEGLALPYDPEQARRLLAEAGYPHGKGLPTIRMVNGHASLSVEADLRFLQDQWQRNLGVNMVWETIWEMGAFLHRMRVDPPHLFFIRWAGKHTDPDDFLHLESSLVWEIARWHHPDYFALVRMARRLVDWSERMALYRQADQMLIEEAVLLPIAYDRVHFLVKPWVSRFTPSAIERWPLSEIILQPH